MNENNLSKKVLWDILQNIYNEVYVIDKNMDIVYVNNTCTRHYGLLPSEMIGKNHMDFVGDVWYPTVIPEVFREKRTMRVEQVTYTGESIISTAKPVLDKNGEIELIVCTTEEKIQNIDISYNPDDQTITYANNNQQNLRTGDFLAINDGTPEMAEIIKLVNKCSQSDVTILIQGESGTGKTLLADYIHRSSKRKDNPFVVLNCSTIPPNLMEVELFGCTKNAFTDAPPNGKKGLFEVAEGGTLFLDEIGELPLSVQAKLLSVIESKKFIPVGGSKEIESDIRIISATNKDLESLVKDKSFREDLFWRFNVVDFHMPPLRERTVQIPLLVENFIVELNKKYNSEVKIDSKVIKAMMQYAWPGNIRQLKNTVERMMITAENDTITLDDLSLCIEVTDDLVFDVADYNEFIEKCRQRIVKKTLEEVNTTREIAERLNISQTTATRLINNNRNK